MKEVFNLYDLPETSRTTFELYLEAYNSGFITVTGEFYVEDNDDTSSLITLKDRIMKHTTT